jgi:hypothetical protein
MAHSSEVAEILGLIGWAAHPRATTAFGSMVLLTLSAATPNMPKQGAPGPWRILAN